MSRYSFYSIAINNETNCDDYAEELLGICYHRNQLSASQYATVCCRKEILTAKEIKRNTPVLLL